MQAIHLMFLRNAVFSFSTHSLKEVNDGQACSQYKPKFSTENLSESVLLL